jgi:hypothetical protein
MSNDYPKYGSKDYIKSLELQYLKLTQKLKVDLLLQEIEICKTVIDSAGDPNLISLFKNRRDKAVNKLKELQK